MFRSGLIRSSILGGVLASSLTFGGAALAQDTTPEASPAATPEPVAEEEAAPLVSTFALINPEGGVVSWGSLTEEDGQVTVVVANSGNTGLSSGEHGIHVHETGACDPEGDMPFSTAGAHFNPEGFDHGGLDDPDSHAGDLGNLTVTDDSSFVFEVTTDKFTLAEGAENSLNDEDGSALIIHENPDDLATDPSGESGGRIACGIIFRSTVPVATPAASPEASPVS